MWHPSMEMFEIYTINSRVLYHLKEIKRKNLAIPLMSWMNKAPMGTDVAQYCTGTTKQRSSTLLHIHTFLDALIALKKKT